MAISSCDRVGKDKTRLLNFYFLKGENCHEKKLKKVTVLFCAVCMLNALLAGCGSQPASAPEAAPQQTDVAPPEEPNAAQSAGTVAICVCNGTEKIVV